MFEIGKKYRRRDGKVARCIGIIDSTDLCRRVCWESIETIGAAPVLRGTDVAGNGGPNGTEKFDITYMEPITEPVKVAVANRFLVLNRDGTSGLSYRTKQEAVECASRIQYTLGIYELPAEIEVTPV